MQVSIVDANGYPIEYGEYSWKSVDGRAKSSKKILGTGLGVVELKSIPAKEVELTLISGITAEGLCMFAKTKIVPVEGNIQISLPEFELPVKRKVVVTLPGGQPVPNATVNSSGLSGRIMIRNETFKVTVAGTSGIDSGKPSGYRCWDFMAYLYSSDSRHGSRWWNPRWNNMLDGSRKDEMKLKGLTDASGTLTLKGWPISDSVKAQGIFDDGVLKQETDLVETNPDGPTTFTLDYFPILKTSSDDIDAYMNELVSLPISVVDSYEAEPMTFSRFISEPRASRTSFVGKPSAAFKGLQVEVIPPPSANGAKCTKEQTKRETLKATTKSNGKAVLKVCVTTSGNYQIKGKGAVSIGKVSIHVNGAPPMAPTALSTRPGVKKTTVAWGLPTYSGGTPILKYVVTATSAGQKTKTIEVKKKTAAFNSRMLTISSLAAPKNWSISVVAVTKNGQSEKATVFVNVPNK
jgi:hypothetical protein